MDDESRIDEIPCDFPPPQNAEHPHSAANHSQPVQSDRQHVYPAAVGGGIKSVVRVNIYPKRDGPVPSVGYSGIIVLPSGKNWNAPTQSGECLHDAGDLNARNLLLG
jgi:hypothetical protein